MRSGRSLRAGCGSRQHSAFSSASLAAACRRCEPSMKPCLGPAAQGPPWSPAVQHQHQQQQPLCLQTAVRRMQLRQRHQAAPTSMPGHLLRLLMRSCSAWPLKLGAPAGMELARKAPSWWTGHTCSACWPPCPSASVQVRPQLQPARACTGPWIAITCMPGAGEVLLCMTLQVHSQG